jgi:hypothetical protein
MSAASAILPPRHAVRNPKYTKNFRFPKTPVTGRRYVDAWKMRDYSINFFYKAQPLSPLTKDYWARQKLTS